MSTSQGESIKSASNPGSVVNCDTLVTTDNELSSDVIAYVNVHLDMRLNAASMENSTAAVLNFCKSKILKPYFKVLSTLGWRPLFSPLSSFRIAYCAAKLVNSIYSLIIMAFILSGYFLQYCVCYRGDGLHHLNSPTGRSTGEFCELPIIFSDPLKESISASFLLPNLPVISGDDGYNVSHKISLYNASFYDQLSNNSYMERNKLDNDQPQTCNSKMVSHFIIPDLLHFFGYLYVFYMMRNPDCERLENLMERVFLQTSRTSGWHQENKRLVRTLRTFLLSALVWILIASLLHLIHFHLFKVCFPCIPWTKDQQIRKILTYLTIASLSFFDIICIAVVTSYAVHCQLNISFIRNLCRSIREKQISLEEFYKRVEESRKFVDYLNREQALGVFLLLVVFICKISIFLYEMFFETIEMSKGFLMIISFLLWTGMTLVPLIQGVRLTGSCKELKRIGHEIRARPFGYHYMDRGELDSLLLYTSTLDMEAKVFHIPMRSSSLIIVFLIFIAFLPLLGQINIIAV